jgi:hypothetical protein
MPPPAELVIHCTDRQKIDSALQCLKASHPPENYEHLTLPMLMRKMLPRLHNGVCVHGARVFWQPGTNSNLDMAVFFFLRMKCPPKGYVMSVGVGANLPESTISSQLQAACQYMQTQPGGQQLMLLSTTSSPVTLRPQLDLAFTNALNANPPKLVYDGVKPPCPPPWPVALHCWRIQP